MDEVECAEEDLQEVGHLGEVLRGFLEVLLDEGADYVHWTAAVALGVGVPPQEQHV